MTAVAFHPALRGSAGSASQPPFALAHSEGSVASISRVVVPPATTTEEALQRCRRLLRQLPPMEGSMGYVQSFSIEEALEQHKNLMRQHELQSSIGQNHLQVRMLEVDIARQAATEAMRSMQELTASSNSNTCREYTARARQVVKTLHHALCCWEIEQAKVASKTAMMEKEIEKSNKEMVELRSAIDDVAKGGGPIVDSLPAPEGGATKPMERRFYYCSDCKVGGHGQRFCKYLLKRPNWKIYPSETWFEDSQGHISHCPLGRQGVDFTDETHFSRIVMHIKGRIWLEDKRKLYEFVPDLMPPTYVIVDQKWVGSPPPAEEPGVEPMPWFVKETDRNWGTSVVCCQRPEECMGLVKNLGAYVVQRHIPKPLLYNNGEKCHIKFYNLLVGEADGVTWKLYTYKDGYLSISPKPWSNTDLSKETQVTIIRTKRINDWEYWESVYPKCQQGVKTVVQRAAEQGKLVGRSKIQFEIISADYIVTEDLSVYLLEFNTGPVLKDPEDSPDVHDAGMINGALHIVEPWEQGTEDHWDFVFSCKGKSPEEIEAQDVV